MPFSERQSAYALPRRPLDFARLNSQQVSPQQIHTLFRWTAAAAIPLQVRRM